MNRKENVKNDKQIKLTYFSPVTHPLLGFVALIV